MGLTQEQVERRKHGIFASEAAAAIGLSRYATPVDVYLAKVGRADDEYVSSEMARMGSSLERAIIGRYLEDYTRETGRTEAITTFPDTMWSPEHEFMGAHLDLWIHGDRVVDAKLHGGQDFGEPGTDQVPQEYICQLHHQMIVAGVSQAEIAAFVLVQRGRGRTVIEFRRYPVPLNPSLAALLVERERALWECVQSRTPPAATSPADEVKLWSRSAEGKTAVASDEVAAAVARLRVHKPALKVLSESIEADELIVKAYMRDAETLVDANGAVYATYKSDAKPTERLDIERLKAEAGGVYRQYLKMGSDPVRRFYVKFPKEKA